LRPGRTAPPPAVRPPRYAPATAWPGWKMRSTARSSSEVPTATTTSPSTSTAPGPGVVSNKPSRFFNATMYAPVRLWTLRSPIVFPVCPQTGKTIGDLKVHSRTGAYIVALKKREGLFDTTPGPGAVLVEGDVVVAVGTSDELRAVERIFQPGQAVAGA